MQILDKLNYSIATLELQYRWETERLLGLEVLMGYDLNIEGGSQWMMEQDQKSTDAIDRVSTVVHRQVFIWTIYKCYFLVHTFFFNPNSDLRGTNVCPSSVCPSVTNQYVEIAF